MFHKLPGFFQTDPNQQFSVRGSRPGSTLYVVDGIKMRQDPGLPFSAIEQIQVMTGAIPAKYGDATGGIIVITTRSFRTKREHIE